MNSKLPTLASKAELKTEQGKIKKVQTHDLSFFLGKDLFHDDGFQKMFVYHPTLDMLELKKARLLIILSVGNQSGMYNSELKPLYMLTYIALNFLDIGWE